MVCDQSLETSHVKLFLQFKNAKNIKQLFTLTILLSVHFWLFQNIKTVNFSIQKGYPFRMMMKKKQKIFVTLHDKFYQESVLFYNIIDFSNFFNITISISVFATGKILILNTRDRPIYHKLLKSSYRE